MDDKSLNEQAQPALYQPGVVKWRKGKPNPKYGIPIDWDRTKEAEDWARNTYPKNFHVDSDAFSALRYAFTFRDKFASVTFAFCTDPTDYAYVPPSLRNLPASARQILPAYFRSNLPREKWISILLAFRKVGLSKFIPVEGEFPDTLEEAVQLAKLPNPGKVLLALKGTSFYAQMEEAYREMAKRLFPSVRHHELYTAPYEEDLSLRIKTDLSLLGE